MFSGNCFVNKEGRPTMCYHQVGQGNAMAVALDDDLNEWEKLATNPITPRTQPGDPHHDRYRSWDPFGWVEGDTYYAFFGGNRPAVAKAKSLGGEWKYAGDLMANSVPGVSIDPVDSVRRRPLDSPPARQLGQAAKITSFTAVVFSGQPGALARGVSLRRWGFDRW
jgi:hypothetical protein